MRIERRLSVNNRAENQRATSARDACDNAAGRYFADPLIRVIADQEMFLLSTATKKGEFSWTPVAGPPSPGKTRGHCRQCFR